MGTVKRHRSRSGRTAKISISLDRRDLALLRGRARRLFEGNLSAVIAEGGRRGRGGEGGGGAAPRVGGGGRGKPGAAAGGSPPQGGDPTPPAPRARPPTGGR